MRVCASCGEHHVLLAQGPAGLVSDALRGLRGRRVD
ncbi:hypothetical protein GZL_02384 [Streptomyces sp. 769]|nr:hypothetical protein GZL_02384 [Streptomyces sp. 769]